jgi:hypothetical protein
MAPDGSAAIGSGRKSWDWTQTRRYGPKRDGTRSPFATL